MIDGYTILNLFSLVIAPLVALAAPNLTITKQVVEAPALGLDADRGLVFTLTVTNTGDQAATNVAINDTFPASYSAAGLGVTSIPTISPQGTCSYTHISQFIVNCSVASLGPGQSVEVTFQACRGTTSSISNSATVSADGIAAITSNTATGTGASCATPTPSPSPGPGPQTTVQPPPDTELIPRRGQPAIICDPAETGCVGILPNLGVRFSAAQNPVLCSSADPRGCQPFQPVLGARYTGIPDDIKPDIRPGECSVLEDQTFRIYEGVEPVETTFCEVQTYPEGLLQNAPQPVRNVLPPDTSDLDGENTQIDVSQVQGVACRGLPGDPWWSESCGCTCDEQCVGTAVPTCFDSSVGECVPIVRHDIAITSVEECQQDPQPDGHFDPIPGGPIRSF